MKIIGRLKQIPVFFENNKKTIQAIILAVIGILSIYSWTLPISDDFCKLSILQRTFVVISAQCGIVFLGFMITTTIKNAKKDKKYLIDLFYISPIVVIETIGVCMLFDHNLWGHKSLFAGLSLIFILFVEAFASIRTLFNKTFGKENTPVILISFAIVSLFLAVVSETAGIAEPANICYKICLGIAYLITTALFTDKYLYRPKKDSHTISHIIGIVSWGSLITITFPFYVQWCGLTGTDFDAFVSVYAAVLGGGITLAGVAWTIKDANDKRKEDLQRIESERKEEDRKKNIPYLMLANDIATSNVASVAETKALDFTKEADIAKIQNDTYYVIKFDPFTVKNVSDSNVVLKGLFFNDRYHPFKHRTLVDKGGVCQIQVGINHWFAFPQKINTTKLLAQDILSNEYVIECQMYSRMDDKPQRDTAPNGLEYLVCSYIYTAVSLMLPDQKKEETTSE